MTIPSLSHIEADLISAAAFGPTSFHAACFAKLAAMELDAEDRAAIVDMIEAEMDGFEKDAHWTDFATPAIAAGAVLAPMALEGSKYLAGRSTYDSGWDRLHEHAPDVVSEDPVRAKALYDLLHSTAPSVASNTPVAADLMRQMLSMPMTDIGTVGGLADIGKSMSGARGPSSGPSLSASTATDAVDQFHKLDALLRGKKMASVPIAHVTADGIPCVFNWASQACKTAGLTDAFTPTFSGHGTTMDQANSAMGMEQQAGGQGLLPLDAVVRELLAKEMELSQREQVLQQQEMAMQQASQMQGQIGQQYQGMTGVDPSTGQPADTQDPNAQPDAPQAQDPQAAQPAQPAPGQDPAAADGSAPPQAAPDAAPQDPAAGQAPGQDPGMADQGQTGPQQPMASLGGEDIGAVGHQDPNAVDGHDQASVNGDNPEVQPGAASDAQAPVGGPEAGAPDAQDPTQTPAGGRLNGEAPPAEGDPEAEGAAQDPNAGMADAEAGAPPEAGADAGAQPEAGAPPEADPSMGAPAAPAAPAAPSSPFAPMGQPQGSTMTVPLPPLQIHVSFAPMA